MEFAEPGKYSSQARQAKVSEGREDWSLLLELNLRNDHNDETWKGPSSGQSTCVLARTPAVSLAQDGLPVCRSLMYAANFESQNVLPRQTAAVGGQKRAERSLMGTWNLHATGFSPLGYYIYIFAKPCPGKWSFKVPRSERRG